MATIRTTAAGGGTTGTGNRTATITPAVGDLLVVFCSVAANTNTNPSCSDNNADVGGYALIDAMTYNTATTPGYVLSAFVRTRLMKNTTSTIVTVATGSNTSGNVVVYALASMTLLGAAAIRQFAIEQEGTAGGTPQPSFAANALTANLVLGAVGNTTNPATMTKPAGTTPTWTEDQDVGQASPTVGLETISAASGFTGTQITWGSTSASTYADIIIEFNISATYPYGWGSGLVSQPVIECEGMVPY